MIAINQQVRTFQEAREAVETRFTTMFDTLSTPVQFSNMTLLKKGNEGVRTPFTGPTWVRLNLIGGQSVQQEVTRAITTINGIINIGVFSTQDIGAKMVIDIVDEIFPIFNAVVFNGIRTGAANVREIPPNNGWYQMNITVPYKWYRAVGS